jgi:hypothetical protein
MPAVSRRPMRAARMERPGAPGTTILAPAPGLGANPAGSAGDTAWAVTAPPELVGTLGGISTPSL